MSIIDYIVIGLILLFAIMGFVKGFFKAMFSFVKGVAKLFLSLYLAKPLSIFLSNVKLGAETIPSIITSKFGDKIIGLFVSQSTFDAYGGNIAGNVLEQNLLSSADKSAKCFAYIVKCFFKNMFAEDAIYIDYGDFTTKFCYAFMTIILIIISFLLILIVLSILFAILTKLFSMGSEKFVFRLADRFLGMGFGVLKAGLLILVAMFILKMLSGMPILSTYITNIMEQSTISLNIYNIAYDIFSKIISIINFENLLPTNL